jgi:hypothetical protein
MRVRNVCAQPCLLVELEHRWGKSTRNLELDEMAEYKQSNGAILNHT